MYGVAASVECQIVDGDMAARGLSSQVDVVEVNDDAVSDAEASLQAIVEKLNADEKAAA